MLGLVLAWWFQWGATDLVWSLWLSSLVVGYVLIVWKVSAPLREMIGNMAADKSGIGGAAAKTAVVALVGVGTLFGLAFYTVHFGGFHFVHSMFLQFLFPVTPEPMSGFFNWSMYAEVFSRYWWFLPAAFIAERHAFGPTPPTSLQSGTARSAKGAAMMEPYKNVVRMHLLIFFFVFAHFARLDGFVIYAVVYAVYFFPWRLLRSGGTSASATT